MLADERKSENKTNDAFFLRTEAVLLFFFFFTSKRTRYSNKRNPSLKSDVFVVHVVANAMNFDFNCRKIPLTVLVQ